MSLFWLREVAELPGEKNPGLVCWTYVGINPGRKRKCPINSAGLWGKWESESQFYLGSNLSASRCPHMSLQDNDNEDYDQCAGTINCADFKYTPVL